MQAIDAIKMEMMCVECVAVAASVGLAANFGYLPADPMMLALAVFALGIVAKPVTKMVMSKIYPAAAAHV